MKLRTRTILKSLLSLALVAWALTARADLQLSGMAIHANFGQNQFIAAVYCESPTTDARQLLLQGGNKAMELRVLAEQLYPRRFKRMWIEGMAINSAPQELEKHAENMAQFSQMLKVKLRVGDNLRIEKNDAGLRILVDGHLLGSISDPSFFDLLLRTWVGPVPLSTSFKNDLLAGGEISGDLTRLYIATIPLPERIRAITAALAEASAEQDEPAETRVAAGTVANDSDPELATTGGDAAELTTSPDASEGQDEAEGSESTASTKGPGLVSEADLFENDSILDDDDEEALTAEALLDQQLYISKLTRWTSGYTEYPRRALRNEYEGTVRLLVVIDRSGKVVEVQIEESSSHKLLDDAALKAVKRASPYPAVPASISEDTFAFSVPVVFRIR